MSEIIVQKFGGTSVGSDERINAVANIIKNATKENKVILDTEKDRFQIPKPKLFYKKTQK